MCILKKQTPAEPTVAAAWYRDAAAGACEAPPARPTGSARRKLWQLSAQAACPVVGVCLGMADLARLARKAGIDTRGMSEYALHTVVVSQCKQRTVLAEAVQRELDARFALLITQARKIGDAEVLADWCVGELEGGALAGVLWVTLTHARCSDELEHELLGRVHMIQHQVGMAARADHSQLDALAARNAQLHAELRQARERQATLAAEWSARQQAWREDEMRLRAEAAGLQAELARTRQEVESLRQARPDLPQRLALSESNARLEDEVRALRRELTRRRHEPEPARDAPAAKLAPASVPAGGSCGEAVLIEGDACGPTLRDRTVLCVGGRAGSVPLYREVVEHRGARFLHHDGGDEDGCARLAGDLTAADLVLCQVGCIGHNAYWRVKEHCKRHNKPCMFLPTPSRAALERALGALDAKGQARDAD
jgi:hypothetical protein